MIAKKHEQYIKLIKESHLSIYDFNPNMLIPDQALEYLLNKELCGISLANLPIRSRSKVLKKQICKALGYPEPLSFKKTHPRFICQLFDTYIQKSNNLQIWNEEIDLSRRYVLVKLSDDNFIVKVKVVTGDILAKLDKTGTLTQKYQARFTFKEKNSSLLSENDTEILLPLLKNGFDLANCLGPNKNPEDSQLLPIQDIFNRLNTLVGTQFPDTGSDQERNRGAALHRLVCHKLGYSNYRDDGQFPDVRHQLLEIKLQTSPTIDLGLVRPNSVSTHNLPQIGTQHIRHCDVRYALFYGIIKASTITLTHLYLTTGLDFFNHFQQFQGKITNKKLQIPLPLDFFSK